MNLQTQKLSVEEIAMKLRPVFGKKIDEIYLRYSLANTKEEKDEIENILNTLYRKNLSELLDRKVLLEPPSKEAVEGEYPLALVSYADKKLHAFNLREQDWVRHVCISGMSGSGKTTLAFNILTNFLKYKKPFMIFDWKKSFRPLMSIDPEIMLYTIGNEEISNYLRININQPPKGISPKEWINVICDLLTESFFASYGVHKVMLETLDEAFKESGAYNNSKNYPTWNEIKWRLENKLDKAKSRESTWIMSALRIAHVLTFGSFGKALNYKGQNSVSVEELLNQKIIFELNSLGNIEKKFFCEFLLTYIYKLKKANQTGIKKEFEHAIIVDEAHNIFLKNKTNFVNESVTDMIYREMREYGTSLVCLDQHISKISDTVAGNSAVHFAFQQQLPQDIETISGLMQLKDNKNFFSMLPVGTAIVKLSERYTRPFLVEVPDVDLRKVEVTDKYIADKMKLVYQTKELAQGKDNEFRNDLINPKTQVKEQKARTPNHALYNGDLDRVRKSYFLDNEKEKKAIEENKDIPNQEYINNSYLVQNFPLESDTDKDGIINKEDCFPFNKEKQGDIHESQIKQTNQVNKIINDLTNTQKTLLGFVITKIKQDWHLHAIERYLEDNVNKNPYTLEDVYKTTDFFLKSVLCQSSKNVTTIEKGQKQKLYKQESDNITTAREINKINTQILPNSKDISEQKFLEFLQKNPSHEYSTVELYKILGLSARKGNKVKEKLLRQGKIKINEIKDNKGWKKIITL
ncbi:MAG: ATP-binding protein [Candidatus Nanoarchaeia archaeon]